MRENPRSTICEAESLNSLASSMSVQEWMALIVGSANESSRDPRLPRLPPDEVQKITNNCHGLKTLQSASKLYAFVASEVHSHLGDSKRLKLLDFGCGWGRFARFFPQLTAEENVYGVDIDARLIAACREYLPRMNFSTIKPRKALPFEDGTFDFVFSNSVFSHLNEKAHRFYIAEIARCTRPGGLLIATTLGPQRLRGMYDNGKGWLGSMARKFKAGDLRPNTSQFLYRPISVLPISRLRDYGLAFVPEGWTRTHWLPYFDVVDVRTNFSQDVNIALRRN